MTNQITRDQWEVLVDFMQMHKDLARGLLRSLDARASGKKLWKHISNELNACGGSHKTVTQWQKVWRDKKYAVKKAASAHYKSARATGGGPSNCPPLTELDNRIIEIMGEGYGEPQTTACVNAFNADLPPSSEELEAPVQQSPSASVVSFQIQASLTSGSRGQASPSLFFESERATADSLPIIRGDSSTARSSTRRSMPVRSDSCPSMATDTRPGVSSMTAQASSSYQPNTDINNQQRRPIFSRESNNNMHSLTRMAQIEEEKLNIERQKVTELSGIRLALNELVNLMKEQLRRNT